MGDGHQESEVVLRPVNIRTPVREFDHELYQVGLRQPAVVRRSPGRANPLISVRQPRLVGVAVANCFLDQNRDDWTMVIIDTFILEPFPIFPCRAREGAIM